MKLDYPFETIQDALKRYGRATFQVLRESGSVLADVRVEGNHRVEMHATVYHNKYSLREGAALIFRAEDEELSEAQLWSAFGSAYARAVDGLAGPTEEPAVGALPVGVGDFVEFYMNGARMRGVVVDQLQSARSGATITHLVFANGVEHAVLASTATLVAKGA